MHEQSFVRQNASTIVFTKSVEQDKWGWWFWDETRTVRQGPFNTEREAQCAQMMYCAVALDGEEWTCVTINAPTTPSGVCPYCGLAMHNTHPNVTYTLDPPMQRMQCDRCGYDALVPTY